MEKVTGIGGVFLSRCRSSRSNGGTKEHLGVTATPASDEQSWRQEAGPTVFEPFPADTDYFGRSSQSWMINFRVSNLDAMVGAAPCRGDRE